MGMLNHAIFKGISAHNFQRIEELGYDKHERLYYVLDDNRLYRRTDPPIAPARRPKPKANTLKAQATRRRTSKRRRVQESETTDADHDDEGILETETSDPAIRDQVTHTLDGFNWECIAITLAQYQEFCDSFKNSKHPDEKLLHERLLDHVLPAIEKAEESQRRKVERKERELQNHQKLASAKRSSRLADKHDRERQERLAEEAIRKHATDLAAAHREQERQVKMEQDRRSRMMTREQRIKEREYKRLLHEEELARMEEEAKKVEAGQARGSERNLKAQMEKKKKDLEDLSEEGDWLFDCSGCALHGPNLVRLCDMSWCFRTLLTLARMTALILSRARNVMSGNTASALAYQRLRPRRMTSISSALIASKDLRMLKSLRYLLNSEPVSLLLRLHHKL